MFEGAGSWRTNHPYTVDTQIDHGMGVAKCGVWGFSRPTPPRAATVRTASTTPAGHPSGSYGRTRWADVICGCVADDLAGGPARDHLNGQGGGDTWHLDAADDRPGDC